MTLRSKLFALFGLLGAAPLVLVGIFGYLRSLDALEGLLADETGAVATRAAEEVALRYAARHSDLLLLADNVETERLLLLRQESGGGGSREAEVGTAEEGAAREATASGDATADETAPPPEAYLREVWDVVGASYRWARFVDTSGDQVLTFGRPPGLEPGALAWAQTVLLTDTVIDSRTGGLLGVVEVGVEPAALLPRGVLESAFGRTGYATVFHREMEEVLYHPRREALGQPVSSFPWAEATALVQTPDLGIETRSFTFQSGDTLRVGSLAAVEGTPWAVLSTTAVNEFSSPFVQVGFANLLLVFLVTLVVFFSFVATTLRATRSLAELTRAADQVAAGDLAPSLPTPGSDEVGHLTRAFGLMVAQVKQMLRRVEESRQMAAVGKFASQISHEIRNPLTSLKMNLQALRRGVDSGELIPYATPVEIALREVERLEAVVRGVLSLGRRRETKREPFALHPVLRDSLEACAGESEERGIRVELECREGPDRVLGDSRELEGAIVNLLRNAGEAMSGGGTVRMWTETVAGGGESLPSSVRIHVVDQGPGIPPDLREKIFDPFVSTKEGGTGFGLALALQAVEGHGGSIVLTESAPGEGAHFLVELPLAMAVEAAASGDGGTRAEREESA